MKIFNKLFLYSLAVIALFFASCNDDEGNGPETSELNLSLEFANDDNGGRTENDPVPVAVKISIADADGQMVAQEEKYDVTPLGSGYVIDPILLELGNYTITEFLVLDANDNIAYATPKEGSTLENLVSDALPVNFTISSDVNTELSLEVISTNGLDPEDLGYVSVSFNVTQLRNFLISVFERTSGNTKLTSATLTLTADGDSIFTADLGDTINVVQLRSDFASISMKISKADFLTETINLDAEDLELYETTPFTVILQSETDLENGLVAYYPFSGNATDATANNLDGTVIGAVLTLDKDGNANSAYAFDGSDDRIEVARSALLENQDYTVSAWVKPDAATGAIVSLSSFSPIDNNSGYYLSILDGNMRGLSNVSVATWAASISTVASTLGAWKHVTLAKDENGLRIYENGQLITDADGTHTVNYSEQNPLQIGSYALAGGGGTYFTGSIDEVRIYNRALTAAEIQLLHNN